MSKYPTKTYEDYASEDGYYYDSDAAERFLRFVEQFCTHAKAEWAGKPVIFEEWQKDLIFRPLFGVKRKKDGLRRFRRVWVEIPRKNGKTLMTVPFLLYMLIADGEQGGENFCAAADKEQARNAHDVAKAMIMKNPILRDRLDVFKDSIVHKKSGSTLKVLSSDADTKHGGSGFGIVIDEVHVHPDQELIDVLSTSVSARRQPVVFMITTAGVINTPAYELHQEAENVLLGRQKDDALLPVLFGALDHADPFEPDTWYSANPNLGISKKLEYVEGEATKARNRPGYLATFKQLDLNIWTEGLISWLTPEMLNHGASENPPIEDLHGRRAWIGMDLATTKDIVAKAVIVEGENNKLHLYVTGYLPEEAIMRKAEMEYLNVQPWIDMGILKVSGKNSIDYADIERDLREDLGAFDVQKFGYDGFQAHDLTSRLMHDYGEEKFFKVVQSTPVLDYPTRTFEAAIQSGDLIHGNDPLFLMAAKNGVLYMNAEGQVRVSKKHNRRKIDPLVATINAIAAMIKWKGEEEEKPLQDFEIFGI